MYPKLNILQRFCYIPRSFAHFGYEMALGGMHVVVDLLQFEWKM